MQIDFPSDDAPWDAPDPTSWHVSLVHSRHPPSFRNALRELAGRGVVPDNLSEISLWILLHGLVSVSWTLLWRDLGDLSMIHESSIAHWKSSLKRAFASWRSHISRATAMSGHPLDRHIYLAGIPFAHLGERYTRGRLELTDPGCVLLLTDTEQIRIFAGASSKYDPLIRIDSQISPVDRYRPVNGPRQIRMSILGRGRKTGRTAVTRLSNVSHLFEESC